MRILMLLFLVLAACASSHSRRYAQYQYVSKNKVSQDCFGTVAVCLEEAFTAARKDCESESRIYELESYETTPTVSLKYRCKWLEEKKREAEGT